MYGTKCITVPLEPKLGNGIILALDTKIRGSKRKE
ncbi:hypothetical protein AA0119_g3642 [Alternaria tenuissima]|uniref:Uncharacterized protein n=1 Tax=Alternaria tenuissima TaxID=119927 RepID=A0ABY0GL55_9PLEO|nr:hypothetical protein AA0119_g3642 [Alternaria tenuissima]RYO16911.1 hypothetical protein AA0121_g6176 [Alternaria tenuissima]